MGSFVDNPTSNSQQATSPLASQRIKQKQSPLLRALLVSAITADEI
jgi:hypothetical protein